MSRNRIELFGTRTCPFTREMQEDLDWDGRSFTVYYVDEDASSLKRLSTLVGDPIMVPVLVENGKVRQVGHNGRGCYVQTETPE